MTDTAHDTTPLWAWLLGAAAALVAVPAWVMAREGSPWR